MFAFNETNHVRENGDIVREPIPMIILQRVPWIVSVGERYTRKNP